MVQAAAPVRRTLTTHLLLRLVFLFAQMLVALYGSLFLVNQVIEFRIYSGLQLEGEGETIAIAESCIFVDLFIDY